MLQFYLKLFAPQNFGLAIIQNTSEYCTVEMFPMAIASALNYNYICKGTAQSSLGRHLHVDHRGNRLRCRDHCQGASTRRRHSNTVAVARTGVNSDVDGGGAQIARGLGPGGTGFFAPGQEEVLGVDITPLNRMFMRGGGGNGQCAAFYSVL